jgi:hypothetical protein
MTDKTQMSDEEMVRRLSNHPQIRERISSLLAAVDDTEGDLKLADDAELRLTQELQRMGQEAMQAWASHTTRPTRQHPAGHAHRQRNARATGRQLAPHRHPL